MMLVNKTVRRYISLCIASSFVFSTTAHAVPHMSLYRKIAIHSLSSADLLPSMYGAKTLRDVITPKLSQGNKNAAVLSLFESSDENSALTTFITEDTWRDLELFNRDSSEPVFEKIDNTVTTYGKWTLAHLLVSDIEGNPKCEDLIKEYQRRQNIVKKLVEDESLFNKLDEALKRIKLAEPVVLVFYLNENTARQGMLSKFYIDKSTNGLLGAAQKLWKLIGPQEVDSKEGAQFVLGILDRWPNILLLINSAQLFQTFMSFRHLCGSAYVNWHGVKDLFNKIIKKESWLPSLPALPKPQSLIPTTVNVNAGDVAWATSAAVGGSILGILGAAWNATGSLDHVMGILNSSIELPKSPFKIYDEFKSIVDIQYILQEDLMKLSSALEHLRLISKQIAQTTDLEELLPESHEFFNVFGKNSVHSGYMDELLELLDSSTFKGEPSAASHWGRILAVNSLMGATKPEWAELFKAVGYIDAYMSLAKLMKKSQEHKENNPAYPGYCFPKYLASDAPYISMTNFYDPQIIPSRAVTNNLQLGGNKMRNMFISGPNMGGKSTFIKGIGINLLLMRLGIAAADAMEATPITKLSVCRYIKEETRDNLSNFGKEVSVGAQLIKQARTLPSGEFSITLLDEFLKGSIRQVNTKAAEVFSEKIGSVPNSLCVYITHNLDLVNSQQLVSSRNGALPLFANFSMELMNKPDGSFKQTYKLIEGPTSPEIMNKAGDMVLKQVGLLDS